MRGVCTSCIGALRLLAVEIAWWEEIDETNVTPTTMPRRSVAHGALAIEFRIAGSISSQSPNGLGPAYDGRDFVTYRAEATYSIEVQEEQVL